MYLLVGLGNPGPQYRNHRHNVGFMAVDVVHGHTRASEWREKYGGLSGKGVTAGQEVVLLKPQTFMNVSGRAVQKALTTLGVRPATVIVLHDDLELPFGEVRVKLGGGHGGHNGLRDISATIGADYIRVRIGIGRPAVGTVEHYVLSSFGPAEIPLLSEVLERAASAAESVVATGVDAVIAAASGKKKGK